MSWMRSTDEASRDWCGGACNVKCCLNLVIGIEIWTQIQSQYSRVEWCNPAMSNAVWSEVAITNKNINSHHSGGEWSLGETKYIIGDSYTVGKVWATTFRINWRKKWPLGSFWENAEIAFFAPKNYFWGKNKALVWLYLQSWTWFDVIIILGIKFWWFSFFLDPLLLI